MALNFLSGLGMRNVEVAQRLLNDLHQLADKTDDVAIWEGWAGAAFNLLIGLGANDPGASKTLVSEMLGAVEKHPGPVGGWQTKTVGLVLNAAFTVTKDLAAHDPAAALAFCAEKLGLPEEFVSRMKFDA